MTAPFRVPEPSGVAVQRAFEVSDFPMSGEKGEKQHWTEFIHAAYQVDLPRIVREEVERALTLCRQHCSPTNQVALAIDRWALVHLAARFPEPPESPKTVAGFGPNSWAAHGYKTPAPSAENGPLRLCAVEGCGNEADPGITVCEVCWGKEHPKAETACPHDEVLMTAGGPCKRCGFLTSPETATSWQLETATPGTYRQKDAVEAYNAVLTGTGHLITPAERAFLRALAEFWSHRRSTLSPVRTLKQVRELEYSSIAAARRVVSP